MLSVAIKQQQGALNLDVEFTLQQAGITAVLGRSGAGKTSLINAISGLTTPDSGEISLNNRTLFNRETGINVPVHQRRMGYVFQDARLFPHYSVRGNLRYGAGNAPQALFDETVALLGIEALLERSPAALSGGEKQRVAIGRALLSQPDLLLLDEPLASLDLPRKQELLPYLQTLAQQVKKPMLYISHNLDEILQLADQLIVLEQGKAVCQGPLAAVWNSAYMSPWLSGQRLSTLLHATVAARHPHYPLQQLTLADGQPVWISALDLPERHPVRLRIHADDVSISTVLPQHSSMRNTLRGQISTVNHQPDGKTELTLHLGTQPLYARITRWAYDELALSEGQTVFAQIKSVRVAQDDWAARP